LVVDPRTGKDHTHRAEQRKKDLKKGRMPGTSSYFLFQLCLTPEICEYFLLVLGSALIRLTELRDYQATRQNQHPLVLFIRHTQNPLTNQRAGESITTLHRRITLVSHYLSLPFDNHHI
jgi:hypothetical protein